MLTVKVRDRIRDEEEKAGRERSLHSPGDGIDLFAQRKRRPGMIHDNSNVLGWNKKI